MNKKWKVLLIVLAVLAVLVIGGTIFLGQVQQKLDALVEYDIKDVDLSAIPDGTYAGSYSVFPVAVEVNVTVANHAITAIELVKHQNGQGQAAESIPATVVNKQTLSVDAVTGATYSSKVILLAIQNALLNAA